MCGKQSIQLLMTGISTSSAISVIISATITAVVLKLIIVMKRKRRNNKNTSSFQNSTQKSVNEVNGPFYEEIKRNMDNTLHLSQNVAYQSVKKC